MSSYEEYDGVTCFLPLLIVALTSLLRVDNALFIRYTFLNYNLITIELK